jgi:hypothetical protein
MLWRFFKGTGKIVGASNAMENPISHNREDANILLASGPSQLRTLRVLEDGPSSPFPLKGGHSEGGRAAWLKARRPPSRHAPAWLSPGPDLVQQIGVPV